MPAPIFFESEKHGSVLYSFLSNKGYKSEGGEKKQSGPKKDTPSLEFPKRFQKGLGGPMNCKDEEKQKNLLLTTGGLQ